MNIGDTGTFTDPKDGQVYHWKVMKDGKKWMTQNYNFKSPKSSCYQDKESNAAEYGRLYLLSEAKTIIPTGWRIPTQDEWYHMVWAYNNDDWRALRELMKGGGAHFNLNHSGAWSYENGYYGLGEVSQFWTPNKGGWSQGAGDLQWVFTITNCCSVGDDPVKNKYSLRFMADA